MFKVRSGLGTKQNTRFGLKCEVFLTPQKQKKLTKFEKPQINILVCSFVHLYMCLFTHHFLLYCILFTHFRPTRVSVHLLYLFAVFLTVCVIEGSMEKRKSKNRFFEIKAVLLLLSVTDTFSNDDDYSA